MAQMPPLLRWEAAARMTCGSPPTWLQKASSTLFPFKVLFSRNLPELTEMHLGQQFDPQHRQFRKQMANVFVRGTPKSPRFIAIFPDSPHQIPHFWGLRHETKPNH